MATQMTIETILQEIEAHIDEIYQASIMDGIVDHHSVDMFLAAKGVHIEKCATQMAYDYSDTVLAAIDKHNIEKVDSHYDSDLDAIASSFLVKSLLEHRELPAVAKDLAEHTNKGDYGRVDIKDPEEYVKSLSGAFGSLKEAYRVQASAEIKAKGFSPAILTKYEELRNRAVFELLNAVNQAKIKNPEFDLMDITEAEELVSAETKAALDAGREGVKVDYGQFMADFEKADRSLITVKNKKGEPVAAHLVVAHSDNPLMFTNMAYLRTSPDTVVAVYAGKDRKGGDDYDIGIIPDQAREFDLRSLCLALNKAERKKRDEVYARRDTGTASEKDLKLIVIWENQGDREAFGGLFDMVKNGEVAEEDILRKDPTPLVAAGSLIPASRTSLLSEEKFRAVLEELKSTSSKN